MSDARRLVLAAGVLVSLWGSPVSAQTEALRVRLEALGDSLDVITAVLAARERRTAAPTETVAAGALRVVLVGHLPPPVRAAAPIAWGLLRSRYGMMADGGLSDIEIGLRATGWPHEPQALVISLPRGALAARTGGPAPAEQVPMASGDSLIAEAIARVAADPLWASLGGMNDWLGSNPHGAWPAVDQGSRQQAYVELVTASSKAARGCFGGNPGECASALAFSPPADPLAEWYEPEVRQALVRRLQGGAVWNRDARLRPCLEHNDTNACTAWLAALDPRRIPAPLSPGVRRTLLATALQAGGPDAFSRLARSADTSVGGRLAAAAGQPLPVLLARWREGVMAARPVNLAVTLASTLAVMGWVGLFGFLATRSTRWR